MRHLVSGSDRSAQSMQGMGNRDVEHITID